MSNAIETAATMYTINSIVSLILVAAVVTYIVVGVVREMVRIRKFNKKVKDWNSRNA